MDDSNHRYIPRPLDLVQTRAIDPASVLTRSEALPPVLDAYRTFDQRARGLMDQGRAGPQPLRSPVGRAAEMTHRGSPRGQGLATA